MLKRHTDYILTLLFLCLIITGVVAESAEIWSERTFFFEKESYADWTLPENQDRITDNVWITRKDIQSIFNIAQEDGYGPGSPVDTEWATGDASDWESLTFAGFINWTGGSPLNVIGVDAVVHLISDDIYVDIRIESWADGNTGGGFSYTRAVNPTPVQEDSWSRIRAIYH